MMLSFIGTCVEILDNDWFTDRFASDATQLAYLTSPEDNEDIVELTFDEFINRCTNGITFINRHNPKMSDWTFGMPSDDLIWAYDANEDIHYFFV